MTARGSKSTIRRAESAADRLRALAVGHAATSADQPFAYYAALRLRVPRRREGEWWLFEDEGEAACSLMSYPLLFQAGETVQPGYGIGAVATKPEFRKRGFATELCRHVAEMKEAAGQGIGLLYSAIPPGFYERLGFRAVPAWGHVCEDLPALADSGERATLEPLDGVRGAGSLAALYTEHHRGLHLGRDHQAFLRSIDRNPEDLFFGFGESPHGYVRLYVDPPTSADLVELVGPAAAQPAVLRAVAALAGGLGCTKLVHWLDATPFVSEHFEDRGREKTLPMVRGADALEGARFWASDYF